MSADVRERMRQSADLVGVDFLARYLAIRLTPEFQRTASDRRAVRRYKRAHEWLAAAGKRIASNVRARLAELREVAR